MSQRSASAFIRCELRRTFERALLKEAHRAVYAENVSVTDEVSAVERLLHKVVLVVNDTSTSISLIREIDRSLNLF
jgi:2-C-methyl-D-erythritol 4-phosphate cytidylyltransferase